MTSASASPSAGAAPAGAPPRRSSAARACLASRSAASARLAPSLASRRASSTSPGSRPATRSSSSIRSSAESSRATTAAASSRSLIDSPWTPGSWLVSASSRSASWRARCSSRRASSSSTHGVGSSGRNATIVPAVRQPSHACGSSSSAARSARTTTGCCWRMRSSIRLSGSSNERSSRKSEKSKPSSSLTGTKTASSGKIVSVGAWRASTSTSARACGGSPAARKRRHCSASSLSGPDSRPSKNEWPSASGASLPNSSSAGSAHFETAPWPSVRMNQPPMICLSSASSGSLGDELVGRGRGGRRRGGGWRVMRCGRRSVHAGTGR